MCGPTFRVLNGDFGWALGIIPNLPEFDDSLTYGSLGFVDRGYVHS